MNKPGTPKSLIEAVNNGLQTQEEGIYFSTDPERIENHVLDYLRQKFSIAYLEMEAATTTQEAERVLQKLAKTIGVTKEDPSC